MIEDEQLTKNIKKFFDTVAPLCSFEEYKLTFYLFLFLDYFSRKTKSNEFHIYMGELVEGLQKQSDFENIYAPIGISEKQILSAMIQLNKRGIFNVSYSKEDTLFKVIFMGI